MKTELPDGCYCLHASNGDFWYDRFHRLHRLDGPAAIYNDGDIAYRVNGKFQKPFSIS